jgi:hypothetical protein
VTADEPVTYFDPARQPSLAFGFDRTSETIEVTYPLTRRHLLFMSRRELPRYVTANASGVTMLNNRSRDGSAQVYAYPEPGARAIARQRKDVLHYLGGLDIAVYIALSTISDADKAHLSCRAKFLANSFQSGRPARD